MSDDRGTFEPQGRVPGRPDPERQSTHGGPASAGILAQIDPRYVRVAPGEIASVTVTARNATALVDEVNLRLSGEAAAWAQVAPDSLRLFPGTSGSSTVRFAPPKASVPHAGLVSFTLTASALSQPNQSAVVAGSVEIASFDALAVQAGASTELAGNRDASFPINVTNLGNRPTGVTARATNASGAEVALAPEALTLGPGEEATIWARVRPRSRTWVGQAKTYPFTVSVSGDYAPPQSIDGRMEQRPVMGRGRLGGVVVAAVAVAGVVAIAALAPSLFGGGGPHDTPSSTTPPITVAPSLIADGSPSPAAPTPIPTKTKRPRVSNTPAAPTPPPTPTPVPAAIAPVDYVWCADPGGTCPYEKETVYAFGSDGLFGYIYPSQADGFFGAGADIPCDANWFGGDPTGGKRSACFASQGPAGYWWCAEQGDNCYISEQTYMWFGGKDKGGAIAVGFEDRICDAKDFGAIATPEDACYLQIPSGYRYCTGEHVFCDFDGTKTVAFGYNGYFNFVYDTVSIQCDNDQFGGAARDPYPGQLKSCYYIPE